MRKLIPVLLLILVILAGSAWWWLHRWPASATVETDMQGSDRLLTLATPAGEPHAYVVIATPESQQLADSDLLALARTTGARLVQYEVATATDCNAQQDLLNAAIERLGHTPDLIAGIERGGAQAYRWLAGQTANEASALSVGTKVDEPDCSEPLPTRAEHGHWHLAWNDNPGDQTAIFVRNQANADTTISDYGTPLTTILREQLQRLLLGQGGDVPTVEVPAGTEAHTGTVTFFYSGDGGWRDLDRDSAQTMAENGYPVVGIDTLRYFWEHKSPERVAADLSRLMQQYREKWGAKRFVLAGYSFGADILPAVYNRLPEKDRDQVTTLLLLAFARSGDFEIQVEGWLGQQGDEAQTGPEMIKVPAAKLYCIYGADERQDSGCTQPGAIGETLELPGGHHYDGNYDKLADYMMKAIDARAPR